MLRPLQIGAAMLAWAVYGFADQGTPQPPPPRSAPRASQPKGGGNAVPKGGVGMPGNPVERLLRMPPAERERALEKLPLPQQERIRRRLQQFDSLPQAEKDRQLLRADQLWSLPADKQNLVRQQMQVVRQLPEDRRRLLQREYRQLSRMPEDARRARLSSDAFKSRFTTAEQQALSDLSEYYPVPAK